MSEHADLDQLETEIKKLRLAFEKYFAGVERVEPIEEHNRVKATLRRLRADYTVNTARKFRLQQLQATLITHESYWNRICRQIEEGTYRRHILKAERLLAQRQAEEEARRLEREKRAAAVGGDAGGAAATAGPNAPATAAKKAAVPKAAAKPVEHSAHLKSLHAAYVNAQRTSGATKTLSIEALARTVTKQTATLKERYKCANVEFKVVLKGNKPVLKAIPK